MTKGTWKKYSLFLLGKWKWSLQWVITSHQYIKKKHHILGEVEWEEVLGPWDWRVEGMEMVLSIWKATLIYMKKLKMDIPCDLVIIVYILDHRKH